jgi:hypothetical protein
LIKYGVELIKYGVRFQYQGTESPVDNSPQIGKQIWGSLVSCHIAQPTVETTVQAHATTVSALPKHAYFDTDSYKLYVDNYASRCITNNLSDFVDPPVPADVKIYGTNGISSGTLMETVEWPIENDTGRVHNVRIPRTIYSDNNRSKLLSPQHWSQEANDRYPVRNGTWCATLDDRIILFWDQQKYQKTVYLLPDRANVGIIRSAHGAQKYERAYKAISKMAGTGGISGYAHSIRYRSASCRQLL